MSEKQAGKISVVPDNYTSVTPWIISPSTENLIGFLKTAFEAVEIPHSRITNEAGLIIHAVVKIGNAMLLLFDAREGWAATPAFLNLYVEDIEKTYQQAVQAGAVSVTSITPLWFGEKVCRVLDPFGNLWWINQRIEAVDFTDPATIAQKSSTPEAVRGIAYIQQSLDEALKTQKNFFSKTARN